MEKRTKRKNAQYPKRTKPKMYEMEKSTKRKNARNGKHMKRKNARNQKRTKRITHETEKRFHNRQWQQLASLLQLTHLRDAMDAKKKDFFFHKPKKGS
jgi:hypothetical protein